jgi:hypothetical protein
MSTATLHRYAVDRAEPWHANDPAPAPRPHAGLPFGFARSGLFTVCERDATVTYLKRVLPTATKDITLTYTGPRLNQTHSLLWQVVVALVLEANVTADGQRGPHVLRVTRGKILAALGWTERGSAAREWIWTALLELQQGQIELRTRRQRFSNSLLGPLEMDEVTGDLKITLDEGMLDLLRDEVAIIDLRRKRSLGKSQIAMWLHDFLASQENAPAGIPWTVADLHALSGTSISVRHFKMRLHAAAERLMTGDAPLLKSFSIDKRDRFCYSKVQTKVVILPAHAAGKIEATNRRDDAEQRAREQRLRVLG